MKLFVNYSHRDSAWVQELVRILQAETKHTVWFDQQLGLGSSWLDVITLGITECDCFIAVVTPAALSSAWWIQEFELAVELHKLIFPIIIKPIDINTVPVDLTQIQFLDISEDANIDRALLEVSRRLDQLKLTEFSPAKSKVKPESVADLFLRAERAIADNNSDLAERLYQQVIQADPNSWGMVAKGRLIQISTNRKRSDEYVAITQLANNPTHMADARKAAESYITQYGASYDPQNILSRLLNQPEKPIFLSYSHEDVEDMKRFYHDLMAQKFNVWVDQERLEPGTPEWEMVISKSIRGCLCLIVLLSPDAEQSIWVTREIAFAEMLSKKIIPVLIRGDETTSVPFRLVSYQRVNALKSYTQALQDLTAQLQKQFAL